MLFDGARSTIGMARHHMSHGDIGPKGEAISKAVDIVDNGLRAVLDAKAAGPEGEALVANLSALYGYVIQRLLQVVFDEYEKSWKPIFALDFEYVRSEMNTQFANIATPTEVEAALERGLVTVKFFPAEPMGGLSYLKAIAAPYVDVNFIPTGGVNASNIASYLAFKRVVACGGSWMAPSDWIAAKQFDRIRDESRRACGAARGVAPGVVV